MTPTPFDTIRTRLAFAYEAAETEEDRAWVNEGQEALVVMEAYVERLRRALEKIRDLPGFGGRSMLNARAIATVAIAQPGDAT